MLVLPGRPRQPCRLAAGREPAGAVLVRPGGGGQPTCSTLRFQMSCLAAGSRSACMRHFASSSLLRRCTGATAAPGCVGQAQGTGELAGSGSSGQSRQARG